MKPKLRIDVKLANAYAEGMHPTSFRLRKKKATKPSPLSSCKIQELTLAIREHNVSDNSETCDCTQELEVDLPTGAKTESSILQAQRLDTQL